jgi:hypothetical protein
MNDLVVIGFDPGITGAGAILGLQSGPVVFDLPSVELPGEGKTRKRLHARGLYQILIKHLAGQSGVHGITEALSAGGMGRGNMMSVGSQYRTRGALEATLELVGVELEEVYPASWKKLYGLQGKSEKKAEATKASRQMAVRLYPDLADHLQRAKDHNRAEAVLIAHWYRRELLRKIELRAKESIL